jgi:hypothetical protein
MLREGAGLGAPRALQKLLRSFTVHEEDLLAVMHRIMNSRSVEHELWAVNVLSTNAYDSHPKVDYYVGVRPVVYNALNTLPSAAFGFVQRWICWI